MPELIETKDVREQKIVATGIGGRLGTGRGQARRPVLLSVMID